MSVSGIHELNSGGILTMRRVPFSSCYLSLPLRQYGKYLACSPATQAHKNYPATNCELGVGANRHEVTIEVFIDCFFVFLLTRLDRGHLHWAVFGVIVLFDESRYCVALVVVNCFHILPSLLLTPPLHCARLYA